MPTVPQPPLVLAPQVPDPLVSPLRQAHLQQRPPLEQGAHGRGVPPPEGQHLLHGQASGAVSLTESRASREPALSSSCTPAPSHQGGPAPPTWMARGLAGPTPVPWARPATELGSGCRWGSRVPRQLLWSRDWPGLIAGGQELCPQECYKPGLYSPTGCAPTAWEVRGARPISGQLLSIESLISCDGPRECNRGVHGPNRFPSSLLTAVSFSAMGAARRR